MESHFHKQMIRLQDDLLKMAGLVEAVMEQAFRALIERDSALARQVITADEEIDALENRIHQKTFTLLATQQPVAVDLRFLSACTKLSTFVERVGDQAVNLAFRALTLNELEPIDFPPTVRAMFATSERMVRAALDAFVRRDTAMARNVCWEDDELDTLNRRLLEEMIRWMMEENRVIRRGVETILCGRHLERIGDEATNICEEVVFLVEGQVIKHQDISAEPREAGEKA